MGQMPERNRKTRRRKTPKTTTKTTKSIEARRLFCEQNFDEIEHHNRIKIYANKVDNKHFKDQKCALCIA